MSEPMPPVPAPACRYGMNMILHRRWMGDEVFIGEPEHLARCDALLARVQALAAVVEQGWCSNTMCDGVCYTSQGRYGEPEPNQCQWHYEARSLLSQLRAEKLIGGES